jgi:secreted trypsin-like serine protease
VVSMKVRLLCDRMQDCVLRRNVVAFGRSLSLTLLTLYECVYSSTQIPGTFTRIRGIASWIGQHFNTFNHQYFLKDCRIK